MRVANVKPRSWLLLPGWPNITPEFNAICEIFLAYPSCLASLVCRDLRLLMGLRYQEIHPNCF